MLKRLVKTLRIAVGVLFGVAGIALLNPSGPRNSTIFSVHGLSVWRPVRFDSDGAACLCVGAPASKETHMKILKRIFGFFILLIGLGILGWIAYNHLVEMQPSGRGRSALPALVFSAAAIYVGGKWLLRCSQPLASVTI